MNGRTEQFLERVRVRGVLTKALIVEAAVEAAHDVGRSRDPVADLVEEALASLHAVQEEARLAIRRVEVLAQEVERHGRYQQQVDLGGRAAPTGGGEPLLDRHGAGAVEAFDHVPGGGSPEPDEAGAKNLP